MEADLGGDRAPVQPQREHLQPAAAMRLARRREKERAIAGRGIERAPAFPSARFEREEFLEPAVEIARGLEALVLEASDLAKLSFLAPQLLAALARDRIAQIALGIAARRLQHRAGVPLRDPGEPPT